MSNPLEEQSARLRELARQPATKANRAEAEAALRSKWEGVRSLAAQALGGWGARGSVAPLLEALLAADGSVALRVVIVRELARCCEPDDAPRILDAYFGGALTPSDQHYVRSEILSRFPGDAVQDRLRRETRSTEADRRLAAAYALVFPRPPVPGAKRLMTSMLDDPSEAVRKAARLLLTPPDAA